jgi:predicted metalloendopeptidase
VDSIDNIPWLTDETKPIAKEKVKAIDVFVGFPEDYFDVNYVDNLLSAVSL